MIIGTGIDIVELSRISDGYSRFGHRFCRRILTSRELVSLPASPIPYLASRFAAKEAAVKALGTGFRDGISMHDIEIYSNNLNKPFLKLYNTALERSQSMQVSRIHLSISHGRDHAVAIVIFEL